MNKVTEFRKEVYRILELANAKYNTTVDDLQAHYKQAYETRVITV